MKSYFACIYALIFVWIYIPIFPSFTKIIFIIKVC